MILNFSSSVVTENHIEPLPSEKERVNYLLSQVVDRTQAIKNAWEIVEITLKYPECYIIKFESEIRQETALFRMLVSLQNRVI